MDVAISKILSQVYELEGLLLVIDKHGDDTPAVVYDLVRRHAATIHEMSQLLSAPAPAAQAPQPPVFVPATDEPAAATTPMVSPDPAEPADDAEPEADDVPPRNADDVPTEVFTFDAPAHDAVADEQPAQPTAPAQAAMRVDEKLQRSISQDLRKAFSLNDHFRFRRELFGNNEADFDEAINMVENMNTYSEATDYFFNYLGWDEEVPEVKDFLHIVRHHFD